MKNQFLKLAAFLTVLFSANQVLAQQTAVAQHQADTNVTSKMRKVFMGMTFKDIRNDEVITVRNMPNDTPILIMYFSTDCGHCKIDAEKLPKLLPEYNIPLWMAGFQDKEDIKKFAENYKLNNIKNLRVLNDYSKSMWKWFDIKYVPFIALIDNKGNFIKEFDKLPEPAELKEILRTNEFIEMYSK